VTPDQIERYFKRGEDFAFARWERPIVPMVLGVEAETLSVVKGAIEAIVALAGHKMAETDPEMGANLYFFFLRSWAELRDVPELEGLVPGLAGIIERCETANANQYRLFRFEENGAIRAAIVFIRMDRELSSLPADALALSQATQVILDWGEDAFRTRSPLAVAVGQAVLRPEVADLIRAAYAPELPAAASDRSFALRLFARLGQ